MNKKKQKLTAKFYESQSVYKGNLIDFIMANFQNLQQKVFFEVKTILETLSKVSSVEELMTKQELSSELADRI